MYSSARRWRALGVLLGVAAFTLFLLAPRRAESQGSADPDQATYAKACFRALGLAPEELGSATLDCTTGTPLPVRVDGKVVTGPSGGANQGNPTRCDNGAWLDDDCYGNSYLKVIRPDKKPHIRAALLCRHKTRWSTRTDDFDDVAMIVHNEYNGETCWFQGKEADAFPDVKLDGKSIPRPDLALDDTFWYRPRVAMEIGCIRCHDSGPFMHSRWLHDSLPVKGALRPLDHGTDGDISPYNNSTPPFNEWPTPKMVDLTTDVTCTSMCHHIAAAGSFQGEPFQTCPTWIARATGTGSPHPLETASIRGNEAFQHWMPPGDWSEATSASWTSRYGELVAQVVACCKSVGGDSSVTRPEGCVPRVFCPVPLTNGKCVVPGTAPPTAPRPAPVLDESDNYE